MAVYKYLSGKERGSQNIDMSHLFETCERKYSLFNFTVSGRWSHRFVNNRNQ